MLSSLDSSSRPWTSNSTAHAILLYIHSSSPIILVVFFLAAFTAHSIATASVDPRARDSKDQIGPGGKLLSPASPKRSSQKPTLDFSPARKLLFAWLSVGAIATFVANTVVVILHALIKRKDNWWCGQSVAIYVVASFFIYTLFLISLIDTKPSPTVAHFLTWVLALVVELILLGASLSLYTAEHREPKAGNPKGGNLEKGVTNWEAIEIIIDVFRLFFLLGLIFSYCLFITLRALKQRRVNQKSTGTLGEAASLLNGHAVEYGAARRSDDGGQEAEAGWVRPTKLPSKSWWEYLRGYSLLFPYLWPAKSRRLQVVVVICFVLVMLARVVNLLVPIQVERITNILAGEEGQNLGIPWGQICLYILYRLLQGGNGALGALRSTLWVPVSQYSYQELSTASFEHVHGLSLDFHLGKKTGEVLSALSKGSSINTFLEQVTFQVVPMLIDLGVAIGYFLVKFDAYFALVVAIVTFTYLYLTIRLAQWRAEIRREMVNSSRQEDAVKNDSMMSYETVKYFNAEDYEFNRYRNAVKAYQKAEYKVLISLNIMNVSQNLVFMLGLMVTCFIAAYQVTTGQRTVGKFVGLLTYMAQLQGPLNFFGTFYRSIQSAMINAERMLELFKEKPTVVDELNAQALPTCQGEIRYDDVQFAYDVRKPALNGINFRCAPGTTTALVGESGGGKSTVFRLLFRFYNLTGGSIQVDGHDVKNITIDSLRRHIGVVPQDTVLFNESLMYNLKYANPSATDEEVYAACRAASIHEKILGFPDGYNARVGERGLKLSGGEKQRVAIARTIIKDPRIILLDEATAALDSETEQHIQTALEKLSQGRTTLVIAHRLSTITTADQILVLHAGQVVECGNHEELLSQKGRYASMWRKQIRAQKAAEEAKLFPDRAERLRQEIRGDESTSQSEDERNDKSQPGHRAAASSSSVAHDHHHGMPHGHP
ncbi:MAG: hypothetical protein LQ352_004799 [Teloschistes flavicans]|nr:MAG: hypothetical protein LQ352_004799 [Teloschistes flavicans]